MDKHLQLHSHLNKMVRKAIEDYRARSRAYSALTFYKISKAVRTGFWNLKRAEEVDVALEGYVWDLIIEYEDDNS